MFDSSATAGEAQLRKLAQTHKTKPRQPPRKPQQQQQQTPSPTVSAPQPAAEAAQPKFGRVSGAASRSLGKALVAEGARGLEKHALAPVRTSIDVALDAEGAKTAQLLAELNARDEQIVGLKKHNKAQYLTMASGSGVILCMEATDALSIVRDGHPHRSI